VHWPDARGDTGVADLGYRLRRRAWGQGYATEGAQALVRLAFTDLGVREVVATAMAVNTGSRRVMEKAGLRYARTVHLDWPDPLPGTEHGDVEYRLLRDEWLHLYATTALQAAPPPDAGNPRGQPRAAATTALASSWISASCAGPRNDSA
jgi:hypothetical protein